MIKCLKYLFLPLVILAFIPFNVHSQGTETEFGKSKVQYGQFDWNFYRDRNFEVYFYQSGRNLAQYILTRGVVYLEEVEAAFDYKTNQRIIFVVYNTYSDFKQSNITLVEESYNTGGLTPIVDNIAFVYFDGDHEHFDSRIKSAMGEVLLNELIYGTSVQERLQNMTLINLPDWYKNGLLDFISKDWNVYKQEALANGIKSGHFKKFGRLNNNERLLLGYAVWDYLDRSYGRGSISNILYITHIYKNIESRFNFVLGKAFNQIYREWYDFYSLELMAQKHGFDDISADIVLKKARKQKEITRIRINEEGNKIAYATNKRGVSKIWIFDLDKNETKKIFRKGYMRPDYDKDLCYPLFDWHPKEDLLSVIYEKKSIPRYFEYNLKTKKRRDNKKKLDYVQKVLDFDYDNIGRRVVMSAIKNGLSDIFLFELKSNRFFTITNDIFDDLNPSFVNESRGIVFSSNRSDDTLKRRKYDPDEPLNPSYDIFYYNYLAKDSRLKKVTNTPLVNESCPGNYDTNYLSYLTIVNGTVNRDAARLDSVFQYTRLMVSYKDTLFKIDTFIYYQKDTAFIHLDRKSLKDTAILSIDTAFIYKDTSYIYPLSNYSTNLLFYDIAHNTNKIIEIQKKNNKYRFSLQNIPDTLALTIVPRTFNKSINENYEVQRKDDNLFGKSSRLANKNPRYINKSVSQNKSLSIKLDSLNAKYYFVNDFENVVVKQEKPKLVIVDDTIQPDSFQVISGEQETAIVSRERNRFGSASSYFISFTPDYLVSQFDNSYINSPYLTYDKNEAIYPFFNITNVLVKLGLNDLFKDYRIVGGFRIKGNLGGAEYLLSLENLKRRLDKKISFYRKGETFEDVNSKKRQLTYEIRLQAKYPFSEYSCIRAEIFGRQDRKITLSTENKTLIEPDIVTNWVGGKMEYVFDNSIKLGLNLYQGTRFKLYYEYYRNYEDNNQTMTVFGGDYRKYIKVHKQIIWANRIAFATSMGNSKIVYFLGGEDNWLFPKFNYQIQVNSDINYIYKSLACNLRGFSQNIRNGNSYALINSELRIPIIRYIFNTPVKSAFLDNLQIAAFVDAGTAWTGSDPYSDDNSLNKRIINNQPIKITVISVGEPIVGGFGLGLRTTLLGYFIKVDHAWGVEALNITGHFTYLSLGLDF
jgi:hypothetical protein